MALGTLAKPVVGEVGGRARVNKRRHDALENADGVYGDGGDEDGDAHPGGCGADDAGAENGAGVEDDGSRLCHDADDNGSRREWLRRRGGRARYGGRDGHEHHDVERSRTATRSYQRDGRASRTAAYSSSGRGNCTDYS